MKAIQEKTNTMIEYKGYTFQPETDPWAIKYGSKICVTDGEMMASFKTIPEAKDFVDDLTCDFHWHPLTQTGFDLFHDRKFWQKRYEEQLVYIRDNSQLRPEVYESAFYVLKMCLMNSETDCSGRCFDSMECLKYGCQNPNDK